MNDKYSYQFDEKVRQRVIDNCTTASSEHVIAISGGFDPVHIGHIDYILCAGLYGAVTVILNSDEWLMRKKGYVFQKWHERAAILRAIKGVEHVVPVDDADGTVCEALQKFRPEIFANGGDRTTQNTPEMNLCEELGIRMVFGVGGGKRQSSSELVNAIRS